MVTKPNMVDRRKSALGYPGHGIYPKRALSAIKAVVWHYTATDGGFITGHENFWKNSHGWDIGGYHFYIASDGKIYWNYDLEICTYGASSANPWTCHISVEASNKNKYTNAQIKAREHLTLWLLEYLKLPANKVLGHKEVPGNSTSCPGYSTSELNAFRADLAKKLKSGGGARVGTSLKSDVASGFLRHEYALFKVGAKEGIIVRDRPTLKGKQVATLKHGSSVEYTDVYQNDGYVWIRYSSGKKDYFVPVREGNKEAWGSFHEIKKKDNTTIAKEVLEAKWGNGDIRKKRLESAGYSYKAVQDRVQALKVVPKKDVKPTDKPISKKKEDREIVIDGKVYVVVEK